VVFTKEVSAGKVQMGMLGICTMPGGDEDEKEFITCRMGVQVSILNPASETLSPLITAEEGKKPPYNRRHNLNEPLGISKNRSHAQNVKAGFMTIPINHL